MRFPLIAVLYLSLTPLIGAAATFAGGLVLGLSWLVLSLLMAPATHILSKNAPENARLPLAAFINLLLVFGLDVLLSFMLGPAYRQLQLSIRLLAFNPLLIYHPLLKGSERTPEEAAVLAFQTGFTLLFVGIASGLLRELIGAGAVTPWPGRDALTLGLWQEWAPRFIQGPAGGFLLFAAVGWFLHQNFEDKRARPVPAPAPKPVPPAAPQPPQQPQTEPAPAPIIAVSEEAVPAPAQQPPGQPVGDTVSWGETEASVWSSLAKGRDFDKKRVMVLGCGTGEEVYMTAMKLLEASGGRGRLNVRIRGVDPFAARIDTAKEGVYRESQLGPVSQETKTRYLLRNKNEETRLVKMGQEIRNYVEFMTADLLSENIYFQKPADAVLVATPLDFLPEQKQSLLLTNIRQNTTREAVLIFRSEPAREVIPEGWKKTGSAIYRKTR